MRGVLAVTLALGLAACADESYGTIVSGPYSNANSSNREPFSASSLPGGANRNGSGNPNMPNYGTLGTVGR